MNKLTTLTLFVIASYVFVALMAWIFRGVVEKKSKRRKVIAFRRKLAREGTGLTMDYKIPCETCKYSIAYNPDKSLGRMILLRRKNNQPCRTCGEDFKNYRTKIPKEKDSRELPTNKYTI